VKVDPDDPERDETFFSNEAPNWLLQVALVLVYYSSMGNKTNPVGIDCKEVLQQQIGRKTVVNRHQQTV